MKISFCNSNDKEYQGMLNKLLKPIFLDFQFWYDLDLWDENYESYSIIIDNQIVSNICVYKVKIQFKDQLFDALSIGAVATKEEYRGKGYSHKIMEHILQKYPDTVMFLSANDSVVNFYPRFGFERVYEKLPVLNININNDIDPIKLIFNDSKVWNYVKKHKNFSEYLDCLNTQSINLFHIHLGYLKECLYELPELKTLVIAKQKGSTLKIIGIFSERKISFTEIADKLPFQGINRVEFGFVPDYLDVDYHFEKYDTDPLFVRGVKGNLGNFKFPELSTT